MRAISNCILLISLACVCAFGDGIPTHGGATSLREPYQNELPAEQNRLSGFANDLQALEGNPNLSLATQMRWEAFLELIGTEQQYIALRARLAKADESVMENTDLSSLPWLQQQTLRRSWTAAVREQVKARNDYDEKLGQLKNWISTYNRSGWVNDPNLSIPWLQAQLLIRATRREYQTETLRGQLTRLLSGSTDPRAVKYLAERARMIQEANQLKELIDGKATEGGYSPGWMSLCQKSEALVRSLANNRAG